VVIDRGRMIAHGKPDQLKTEIGGERIEVILCSSSDVPATRSILSELSVGELHVDEEARKVTAAVTDGVDVLRQVLQQLEERRIDIDDVGVRRPTLDDVFLSLTGHAAEEVAESPDGKPDEGEGERADDREKEAVR
jgi:ABC-2 type transport system ATP-binding protein